jgi:oxygen-independent coproporphyrinogen-3 oxidase
VERHHDIDFLSYFGDALQRLSPLVRDGLVSVVGSYISATVRGRLLLRVVAMCFDRYLPATPAQSPEQQRYSRAI